VSLTSAELSVVLGEDWLVRILVEARGEGRDDRDIGGRFGTC